MIVKYFSYMKDATGKSQEKIDFGGDLSGLMAALGKKYGLLFEDTVFNHDKLRPDLIIMLNKKDVNTLDGMKTKIKSDDELVFLPTISGG